MSASKPLGSPVAGHKASWPQAVGTHQPIVSKVENGRPVDDALMARILGVLERAGA